MSTMTSDVRIAQTDRRGAHWLHRLVGASGKKANKIKALASLKKMKINVDYGKRLQYIDNHREAIKPPGNKNKNMTQQAFIEYHVGKGWTRHSNGTSLYKTTNLGALLEWQITHDEAVMYQAQDDVDVQIGKVNLADLKIKESGKIVLPDNWQTGSILY